MTDLSAYTMGVQLDGEAVRTDNYRLWPQDAPQAVADGPLDQPILTVHLPAAGSATGCGVIVCPGGGYRVLASDHEGLQVARWLNRAGIAAFVLRYRVAPTYHSSVSLLDGQRAVRWVRFFSTHFGVDPERLGLLGFSAGGHLTMAVGTQSEALELQADDPVDQQSCRPNFIVPVYAVSNGAVRGRKADEYTPTDEWVSADTPPAFIVTTHGDSIVPANQSTLFYNAMLAAGCSAELHIFADGDHGLGLASGDPDVGVWPMLLRRWLARRGMLTTRSRVAVSGRVLNGGSAMGLLWVSLLPQDENQPIARARINRDSGGAFVIPIGEGPTPGPHRLQIRYVSQQYPHTANGRYSLDDEWLYEQAVEVQADFKIELDLRDKDWQMPDRG